jgi:hypothetical protein
MVSFGNTVDSYTSSELLDGTEADYGHTHDDRVQEVLATDLLFLNII